MPIESPQQFELHTLEALIAGIEHGRYQPSGLFGAIAALAGTALFVAVYYLHLGGQYPVMLIYFMCALGGFLLGSAAVFNRLGRQALLARQYIDTTAVRARIAELKS